MMRWFSALWRAWQRYSLRRKLAPYADSVRRTNRQIALTCAIEGHAWRDIPGLGVVCALCGKARKTQ